MSRRLRREEGHQQLEKSTALHRKYDGTHWNGSHQDSNTSQENRKVILGLVLRTWPPPWTFHRAGKEGNNTSSIQSLHNISVLSALDQQDNEWRRADHCMLQNGLHT